MQAVNSYVIVDKIKEEPKMVGGLEILESQNKEIRYLKGRVISVGEKVPVVKEGDTVFYDKHAGHSIEADSKLYYVIRDGDIVTIE